MDKKGESGMEKKIFLMKCAITDIDRLMNRTERARVRNTMIFDASSVPKANHFVIWRL